MEVCDYRRRHQRAHRSFLNLSYETRDRHWQFDQHKRSAYSPDYFNLLAQVTYLCKLGEADFNVYLGVENLLNYRQANPIVASDLPYSRYFDASMVWGPIYGRMVYVGLRFRFK